MVLRFKNLPGGKDMPDKLNIRYASPADYGEIINIFESWGFDHWDTDYAAKYYRAFFNNCCQGDEVFVLKISCKIVGVTGYCPDPEESDGIYWLNWFYVHKDYKDHGYGRKLLDYVINKLKNKDARKLFVNTTSYRFYKPARDLYKAKGFKEEGILKDFYGKGEHQVIFGLVLKN